MLALLLCLSAPPDMPPTTYLWPDGAPGAVGEEEADKPAVFIYEPPADLATGTAVVLCPGGGYAVHAMDHEGHQVARWWQSKGVTCALLRYRLGERYRHPAPLQDVLRAIRLVRSKSDELNVDRRRVGVMGFSAGGHLASSAATLYAHPDGTPQGTGLEDVSPRPDFAVLCYPVISMSEPWGHGGSAKRLLGPDPSDDLRQLLSTDKQVDAKTPPTFVFHTVADAGVPVRNGVAFFTACVENGVPCELHAFETGPHGVGMAPGDPVLRVWPDLLHNWLRRGGFLSADKRVSASGRVSVGGKPIQSGEIHFAPADPNGPTAFARIGRGAFQIDAARGPTAGQVTVSVTDLGGVKPGPSVEAAEFYRLAEPVDLSGGERLAIDLKDDDRVAGP